MTAWGERPNYAVTRRTAIIERPKPCTTLSEDPSCNPTLSDQTKLTRAILFYGQHVGMMLLVGNTKSNRRIIQLSRSRSTETGFWLPTRLETSGSALQTPSDSLKKFGRLPRRIQKPRASTSQTNR